MSIWIAAGTGENGDLSKKYLKCRNDRIDDQPEGQGENRGRAESKVSGLEFSKNGAPTVVGWFYPLGTGEDSEYF